MPIGDKLQKFTIALVAALLAVGCGLALTHVGRSSEKTALEIENAAPTIGEGRNLTREVLRSRRERNETVAEVHPDPSLGERQPVVTKEVAAREAVAKEAPAAKEASAKDSSANKDAKPKATTATVAVALPRSRPETVGEQPQAPDAAAATAQAEQPRSFGSMVFSTVSHLSGKAANLTGDTANFVIDLPGKLISAGGRLFDRQPAQADPPPPQKREAL
jgi:hypothetical protein